MTTSVLESKQQTRQTDVALPGRRWSRKRSLPVVILAQILLFGGAILLWKVAGDRGWISVTDFGSPKGVVDGLKTYYDTGLLVSDFMATIKATLVALGIGIPLGIFAGLALAAFPFADQVVSPFLIPFNSLPRIALVPVFIIWFGIGTQAKVALAVSIIFFVMFFNSRAGIKSVEPDQLRVAELLCVPRRKIFRSVILPASIPAIFAGVRLAVTYGLLGVVGCEMIAARDGLGTAIVRYSAVYQVSAVFGVLLILGLTGAVLGLVLEAVERRLLRWQ